MMKNIDYTATYFKYPSPTPIHGEPTNKSLKRLKTELRASASSVDIYLGGHIYIDLIISDVEYTRILLTPTPFAVPNYLPTLAIDALATAVQAIEARKNHNEQIRVYLKCKNVEKALLRHIHTALDDTYIEHLVDYNMNLVEDDISTVLASLFTNCSKIQPKEVKSKEAYILNLTFNPVDPMVTLYRPIE